MAAVQQPNITKIILQGKGLNKIMGKKEYTKRLIMPTILFIKSETRYPMVCNIKLLSYKMILYFY